MSLRTRLGVLYGSLILVFGLFFLYSTNRVLQLSWDQDRAGTLQEQIVALDEYHELLLGQTEAIGMAVLAGETTDSVASRDRLDATFETLRQVYPEPSDASSERSGELARLGELHQNFQSAFDPIGERLEVGLRRDAEELLHNELLPIVLDEITLRLERKLSDDLEGLRVLHRDLQNSLEVMVLPAAIGQDGIERGSYLLNEWARLSAARRQINRQWIRITGLVLNGGEGLQNELMTSGADIHQELRALETNAEQEEFESLRQEHSLLDQNRRESVRSRYMDALEVGFTLREIMDNSSRGEATRFILQEVQPGFNRIQEELSTSGLAESVRIQLSSLYSRIWYFNAGFLVIFGFLALVMFLVTGRTLRRISGGIQELKQGTREFGEGNFRYQVPASEAEEISEIGRSLNEMATLLQDSVVRREYLDGVLETMKNPLAVVDQEAVVREANQSLAHLAGLSNESPEGAYFPDLVTSDEEDASRLWDVIRTNEFTTEHRWTLERDGSRRSFVMTASQFSPHHEEDNRQYVCVLHEVTELEEAHERIQELAFYDSLTGLPNRVRFRRVLEEAMEGGRGAVILVELSKMSQINELYGHEMGDQLMASAAQRLRNNTGEGTTVARFGGASFALMVPVQHQDVPLSDLLETLHRRISENYHVDEYEFHLNAALGAVRYPEDAFEVDSLLQRAEQALAKARESSTGWVRFNQVLEQDRQQFHQLEQDFGDALQNDKLDLFYQPQCRLEDGTIKGAEALIRWDHPRFGFVSPPKIIELAASSGKILSTGDWLLREGAESGLDFSDHLTDGFEMSVNVSGAQFQQPDQLVRSVNDTLSRVALGPDHLVLEITESVVMRDLDLAEEILTELTDLGVKVAVDDFGTGYSNFDSLINLPFDILKLDRSFIQGIHESSRKKRLVESMVRLAGALNLTVLVEGVEREEERAVLIDLGCSLCQGFYFCRPIPKDEFKTLLNQTGGTLEGSDDPT